MSLILAIKDKDRIVFGADKQSSTGFTKDHSCTKIWEVPELPGAIMGGVGSMRASQIVQFNKIIDLNDISNNGIDTSFVINSLVPIIIGVLKSNGIPCHSQTIKDDDDTSLIIPNTFLFAYEDRAWMIWNDLSVTELKDYLAIGSGSDVAMGALYATKDKNPFERIVTCIDAAAESTLFVDNGIDLLATDYFEDDFLLIDKALGIEKKPTKKETKQRKSKKQTLKKKKETK